MGAPSPPGFQLDQNFFGFKPSDRAIFHENIFNMLWHGEGRWTWDDVYHLPIPIRRLWTKRINALVQPPDPAETPATKNKNVPRSPRVKKSGR
jgi:hypothetical protein